MNYLQSIFVGFVQGLTEFLPVSSSAHIVFSSAIYKLITNIAIAETTNEETFFDIIIHLGTLCAIFIYFKDEIVSLIKAFYNAIRKWDFSSYEAKISLYIIVGTLFTGIVALPIKNITEKLLDLPHIVGLLLVITGLTLLISDKLSKKYSKEGEQLTLKKSVLIGIAQGLATFPGLSRSGLTIATGIACGLTRVKAAKYSFILSLPAIIGASIVFPVMHLDANELLTFNWGAIICGFIVSAVTGYFCIKYFITFLAKFSLNYFVYYCWAVGIVAFVLFNPHSKLLIDLL